MAHSVGALIYVASVVNFIRRLVRAAWAHVASRMMLVRALRRRCGEEYWEVSGMAMGSTRA